MQKFKNTNYYYENGKLFTKTQKLKKADKNRFKIKHQGIELSLSIEEIDKIYTSNYDTIEEYFSYKEAQTKTVFLPADIYCLLKANKLLNPSIALFLNKILTSEKYSVNNLPTEFSKLEPVEIASGYKEKIGLKKKKNGKISEIEILQNLKIITQIPYLTNYKGEDQKVDYIKNHSKRYIVNTENLKFIPFKFQHDFEDRLPLNIDDFKKRDAYIRMFNIKDKEGLIKEYEKIILEIKNDPTIKKNRKIQQIATHKAQINNIQNNQNTYFRNKTNFREQKPLDQIENKEKKLRDKYTNVKDYSTIDITCSQLRFLYIFLANPNSILFKESNIYYKEQLAMNKKNFKDEIVLLKKNLSQTDFWTKMMEKHSVTDKSILKKELMTFLAAHDYSKYSKYFGKDYPKISEFLCAINKSNSEENIKENQFIVGLQRAEAKFVLDITTNELIRLNIDVFTLHDQWFFEEKNTKIVKQTIDKFTSKYFEGLKNNYK